MSQSAISLTVDEFTTPSPISVGRSTTVNEVMALMDQHGIRHLPVIEAEQPIGIISDRDLRVAIALQGGEGLTADKVMTPDPYTVSPETSLDEVAFTMSKNKYGSAIVQGVDGEVVGIFTSTDALNALIEIVRGQVG